MKKFGLLGYPLGHSLSPFIHRQLFAASNTQASYELEEIPAEELQNKMPRLMTLNGFNVTIPHKINIIPYLDVLHEKAELFGAVNTVETENGKSIGYNTDCEGFLRALKGANIPLSGDVLLCGAGGVSRMIAFEAVLAGCRLTVAVRPSGREKAEKIRAEITEKLGKSIEIKEYQQISEGYDLIVNGTCVGMYPNTNACVLDKKIVQSAGAVYDVIYNPAETLLLRFANEAGIKCSNGISMLVWQAAVAQEIWTGAEFSESDIDQVIRLTEKELLNK